MKSDQKCNCNVSNAVCASIAQRSVLIQPCDLRLITTENVDVKCAAFELVNIALRQKLPEAGFIGL